ncbi:helix-turn-helix domain-containing protein [Arcticibacter sp.]|jgi:AraC-like DNA-binding protein|uniref:helix-turn-helix domain-containing protein n=1 Tax=Arcticibacter sp. TaxID=1872630 RepID=UPI00388D0D8A
MTQSGEESTQKGEFTSAPENVYAFHKSIEISYSGNIVAREQLEMQISPSETAAEYLYQMIFVLKGECFFLKKGSKEKLLNIGDQQHNLCRFTPGYWRMMMSCAQDEIICVTLSSAFLNRYLYNHPAWQKFNAASDGKAPLMLANPNMHVTPEISAILHRLDQKSDNVTFDQLLLESKVIELLALQISQLEQLENTSRAFGLKKEEMDKMIAARDILINSAGGQLSLRSLAHLVGTNEFNLKRDFKIAFGSTVYNYLNRHKMEQARMMLEEEDISIAEVASKLNYKYATHFSVAFKKYFGYLPSRVKSGRFSILLFTEDFAVLMESLL